MAFLSLRADEPGRIRPRTLPVLGSDLTIPLIRGRIRSPRCQHVHTTMGTACGQVASDTCRRTRAESVADEMLCLRALLASPFLQHAGDDRAGSYKSHPPD